MGWTFASRTVFLLLARSTKTTQDKPSTVVAASLFLEPSTVLHTREGMPYQLCWLFNVSLHKTFYESTCHDAAMTVTSA